MRHLEAPSGSSLGWHLDDLLITTRVHEAIRSMSSAHDKLVAERGEGGNGIIPKFVALKFDASNPP